MFHHKNIAGFTFIETMVAVGIFITVIAGANAILQYLARGMVEVQNLVQAKMLAESTIEVVEELLKATPQTGDFHMNWDGTKYVLTSASGYGEAKNIFGQIPDGLQTKFYRKVNITQKESWGLYEVETDVCFEQCEISTKLYKTVVVN
jgi:type II secretory pathway pseudopilin PulG